MTNELATAGLTVGEKLCTEFGQRLDSQHAVLQQAVAELADKSIAFAFDFAAALLLLLGGWIAIRVIVAAVGKAAARGSRKNTLLANFIQNATSKVCWSVLLVLVVSRLGVNVAPIIAGLGVTGFILGFAFQESLDRKSVV